MNCPDCKTKNITDANYCKKCCHNFTEKEKETAYKKTLFGFLDMIEEKYNKYTFKDFTDSIKFKIFSILCILGIGIFITINYHLEFRVENSANYHLQYNKELDEYYLIVKEDETPLNLFLPSNTEKLIIKEWSSNNDLIKETEYEKNDNVSLKVTNIEDYYTIEALYKNDKSDKIKMYVYKN